MAEEKLIIIEEDATNAVGFRVDDIEELEYDDRQSGPGTVQLLRLDLKSGKKLTFRGAEATTVYETLQDSFSEGGVDASPAPIETTQASILAAWQTLDSLNTALSDVEGDVFLRIGTDGAPIELDFPPDPFPEYPLAIGRVAAQYLYGGIEDGGELFLVGTSFGDTTSGVVHINDAGGVVQISGTTLVVDQDTDSVKANTFESEQATGTAPLTVASVTMVENLNADLLDGQHAAAFAGGGHNHDHGALTGLDPDDDHTQYILHSLAGAANDFLVASGANVFAKQTLAQTATTLEAELDHGSVQGLGDDDHTQYLLADGTRGLSADWAAGLHKITALVLESTNNPGAPFTVASTAVVTNLNADLLDGVEESALLLIDGTRAMTGQLDIDSEAATIKLNDLTDTDSFTLLDDVSETQFRIDKVNVTGDGGSTLIDLNPMATDNLGQAIIRMFRATDVAGTVTLKIHKGDNTGTVRHQIGSGAVVFNSDGEDIDFRVEGVGVVNALFVRGSDGNVGIGTDAPTAQLHNYGGNSAWSRRNISASSDAVDVGDVDIVMVITSGGHVVIGGLANGVAGQVVRIAKAEWAANNMTIEHNEATGTQKILTTTAADRVFASYGGMTVVYSGTYWFQVG